MAAIMIISVCIHKCENVKKILENKFYVNKSLHAIKFALYVQSMCKRKKKYNLLLTVSA